VSEWEEEDEELKDVYNPPTDEPVVKILSQSEASRLSSRHKSATTKTPTSSVYIIDSSDDERPPGSHGAFFGEGDGKTLREPRGGGDTLESPRGLINERNGKFELPQQLQGVHMRQRCNNINGDFPGKLTPRAVRMQAGGGGGNNLTPRDGVERIKVQIDTETRESSPRETSPRTAPSQMSPEGSIKLTTPACLKDRELIRDLDAKVSPKSEIRQGLPSYQVTPEKENRFRQKRLAAPVKLPEFGPKATPVPASQRTTETGIETEEAGASPRTHRDSLPGLPKVEYEGTNDDSNANILCKSMPLGHVDTDQHNQAEGDEDDEDDIDIELDLLKQIMVQSNITCIIPALKNSEFCCLAGTADGSLILCRDESKIEGKEIYCRREITALAQLDAENFAIGSKDGYVVIYNPIEDTRYEFRPSRDPITCLACDESGSRIAAAYKGRVSIFSHKKRTELSRLSLKAQINNSNNDQVTAISFISKKLLAVGSEDGSVAVFLFDRSWSRGLGSKKITPVLMYKKRLSRRVHNILTRVDLRKKKAVSSFNLRVLFDSKRKENDAPATVIDISISNFRPKKYKEKIAVVGVSEMNLCEPQQVHDNLLSGTEEGILMWSGSSSSGLERLFICGDLPVSRFAWNKDKLYTTDNNQILVWDAPIGCVLNEDIEKQAMNMPDFKQEQARLRVLQ